MVVTGLCSTRQLGPAGRSPHEGFMSWVVAGPHGGGFMNSLDGRAGWAPGSRGVGQQQPCQQAVAGAALVTHTAPWQTISFHERGFCGPGMTPSEPARHTAAATAFACGRSAGTSSRSAPGRETREVLQSWGDTHARTAHAHRHTHAPCDDLGLCW